MSKLIYIELSIYGEKSKLFQEQLITSKHQLIQNNLEFFKILPNRQLNQFQNYFNHLDEWENKLITYTHQSNANLLNPQIRLYDKDKKPIIGVQTIDYQAFTLSDLYQMIQSIYHLEFTATQYQHINQIYQQLIFNPANQYKIELTNQTFYLELFNDNSIGRVDFKIDLFVQDADARLNPQLLSILESTHTKILVQKCKLIIKQYQNDQLIAIKSNEIVDHPYHYFEEFLTQFQFSEFDFNQNQYKILYQGFQKLKSNQPFSFQFKNQTFNFSKELNI